MASRSIKRHIVSHALTIYFAATPKMQRMRILVLLCAVALAASLESVKYTDKYDNLDLDEILANKRLLMPYANCVLDKGRCNAEAKELKAHLQEALETGCAKCTERQEAGAYKVIEHLIKNEQEIWQELTAKFDPDNKFRRMYEERARAKGIVIPN